MVGTDEVKTLIEAGVPGARATVRDMTGTGDHFDAVVVSAVFEGLGEVQRHRLVYKALGPAMQGPVHALKLTTMTPAEAGQA